MLPNHKLDEKMIGQIASRNIQVFKEFYVSTNGKAHGPMYKKHSYGKLAVGKVLRPAGTRAVRKALRCATGVHSFLTRTAHNRFFSTNEVWEAIIPKGTWFYQQNRHKKVRADRIKLVRKVRSARG